MKKKVFVFISFLTIILMIPIPVSADVGPKPSIKIDIAGLKGEKYYVVLLTESKGGGPHGDADYMKERAEKMAKEDELSEEDLIYIKFATYEDEDGFNYIGNDWDCSKTHRYRWGYYPPEVFKILIYLPETDTFFASEILERYKFNSYYRAELMDSELLVNQVSKLPVEIISFLVRTVLTILVELGIAGLFGIREEHQLRFIAKVNIITQIGLNLALFFISYNMGLVQFVRFYRILELMIFVVEAGLYIYYYRKVDKDRIHFSTMSLIMYSFVANLVSYNVGKCLALVIPLFF